MNVTVMTFKDAEYIPRFKQEGVKVIPFHPEKKLSSGEIQYMRNQIEELNIDILFLFNSKAIINGIQAAKGSNVKVVLYRGYAGNIYWYDPLAYLKYLNPRVDRIICNSKGVEDHINKALFWAKEKTITINKGHDLSWYDSIEPYERSKYPCPPGAFIMCCVANDRRMKGIQYLLRSTYYWGADLPIHLLLIGKGMDKPEYLKIVDGSPNKQNVHIMGFRKDALQLVAGSDAFILSSIKGESITKSVLEAMSLGVAPIITDIPGNKELVNDGESGLVVPSKDPKALAAATMRLCKNKSLRDQLAQNAQDRIRHTLSNQNAIEGYEKLIKDSLK
jgi:glycosyltransferase involved in cell wall biosynthesis